MKTLGRWIMVVLGILVLAGAVGWQLRTGDDSGEDLSLDSADLIALSPQAQDTPADLVSQARQALKSALATVESHDDYVAKFTKRERIGDTLRPAEVIRLKVRHEPFAVYMRFLEPEGTAGQQAIYADGHHDNLLVAHGAGFRRVFGTFRIDPTSSLATSENRHPITSVGIRNLLKKILANPDLETGLLQVAHTSSEIAGRPVELWQFTLEEPTRGQEVHLSRLAIDKQWNVPVKFSAYGFPSDDQRPPLLEEYLYEDFQFDAGLTNTDFDPTNPNYDFP